MFQEISEQHCVVGCVDVELGDCQGFKLGSGLVNREVPFPKNHKVKVFRVASSRCTDYVATNDLNQSDVSVVRQVCDVRWRIEQFHREAKQLTGLEKCQCRLPRIVRNHIGAAFLVWVYLMRKAYETGKTLYQVKHGLLSEYLCQQLKSPMLKTAA